MGPEHKEHETQRLRNVKHMLTLKQFAGGDL